MTICKCPPEAAIQDLPDEGCPLELGQLRKVVFQRIYADDGTKNSISDPDQLASWTPFLAAEDSTKMVTSPDISNPEFGEAPQREYGGENETPGGVPINLGADFTPFTGNLIRAQQSLIKVMKTYKCDEMGVYMIFQNKSMLGMKNAGGGYEPIPIQSFAVGDLNPGTYSTPAMNMIQWSHEPDWSDDVDVIIPADFNPIKDLGKPTPDPA